MIIFTPSTTPDPSTHIRMSNSSDIFPPCRPPPEVDFCVTGQAVACGGLPGEKSNKEWPPREADFCAPSNHPHQPYQPYQPSAIDRLPSNLRPSADSLQPISPALPFLLF